MEGPSQLKPADNRSCVFAGCDASFPYASATISRDEQGRSPWRVHWTLVAKRRILARGSSKTIFSGDHDAPLYVVSIPMPPLRESVVMAIALQMTWTAGGRTYQHRRPLTIYSPDPFTTRKAFLQHAKINLFDPVGKTARILDAHGIPYKRLISLHRIDQAVEGIVLVGEEISFRRQKHLAEALLKTVQRGVPVLCLAPTEGDFPLAIDEKSPLLFPSRLVFASEEIVRRYDQRFDRIPSASRWVLRSRREQMVLSVIQSENDWRSESNWPWVTMVFPAQKPDVPSGRLILCNLGMIRSWKTNPVPRYFFIHLLKELVANTTDTERTK